MAVIEPVARERLVQPKMAKLMALAENLQVPDAQFFQILAHAPNYAEALFEALYESFAKGNVDHRLKEIIRIQLARRAGDPYFAGLRSKKAREAGLTEKMIEAGCDDFEADPRFTDAEKWALRFAYLMYREPKKVNKAFYDEGRRYYSEAQIMEIGAFMALLYGLAVFMRTLKVAPPAVGA